MTVVRGVGQTGTYIRIKATLEAINLRLGSCPILQGILARCAQFPRLSPDVIQA